ncbi:MAG: dephospho-CoA kinase [Pseudomonadota bacterium]
MLKIAITGNIGTGKSLALNFFRKRGDAIFSSDEAIAEIYASDQRFFEKIKEFNPDFIDDDKVSKSKISLYLKDHPEFLPQLEDILYPILKQKRADLVAIAKAEDHKFMVFEIPLLFEKHADKEYDQIILLHADQELRWQRVKDRPNMTRQKFEFMNRRQTNYLDVINNANLVIDADQAPLKIENILSDYIQEITDEKGFPS